MDLGICIYFSIFRDNQYIKYGEHCYCSPCSVTISPTPTPL